MNLFKSNVVYDIHYTNVLENFTSACRNYIHHSDKGDYVRHRTSQQTLADHMQLASRTLDSVLRSDTEFYFSITLSGVYLGDSKTHGNEII